MFTLTIWQALTPVPSLLISSVFTDDLLVVILGTFGMSLKQR